MAFFTKYRMRIYIVALAYLVLGFLVMWNNGDTGDLRVIRLVEWFGIGAAISLYIALVVGPFYKVFPSSSAKEVVLGSRGGFGDAALVFGLLHASLAFFLLLGGFSGWIFLGAQYQVPTLLSLTALIIMLSLFIVSLGKLPKKVFGKFPWFGKIGYVAGFLICIHVIILGSQFRDRQGSFFIIGFALVSLLALLLAVQMDSYIRQRFGMQRFVGVMLVAMLAIGLYAGKWYMGDSTAASVMTGMNHAGMSMGTSASAAQYTLSVQAPSAISANVPVPLAFKVFSASTGTQVNEFTLVHDKLAHLVIVNDALNFYSHIHPELKNGQLEITTSFPKDDNYRAYISFEPKGATVEQVFAYSFTVGKGSSTEPDKTVDGNKTKTFGATSASLAAGSTLSAADIAAGKGKIVFNFKDASTAEPITSLYPYLAAFGHLVMINTDTHSYIHVHPLVTPFGPEDTSGPEVEFMPMGTIQPGVYKLFGQFSPNKELITVPYTIEVTQ